MHMLRCKQEGRAKREFDLIHEEVNRNTGKQDPGEMQTWTRDTYHAELDEGVLPDDLLGAPHSTPKPEEAVRPIVSRRRRDTYAYPPPPKKDKKKTKKGKQQAASAAASALSCLSLEEQEEAERTAAYCAEMSGRERRYSQQSTTSLPTPQPEPMQEAQSPEPPMVMVSELTIQTKALESSSSETSITPPTTSTDTRPSPPITTDTSDPEGRPRYEPPLEEVKEMMEATLSSIEEEEDNKMD